jgi:DNA repair photolyase
MIIKPCVNRPVLNPCTLENLNYQVDPYIGCEHYCYYCYALPQAETDWRRKILFHEDIAGRLEKALAAIPPQTISMGWHSDPYQPCEAECRPPQLPGADFREGGQDLDSQPDLRVDVLPNPVDLI